MHDSFSPAWISKMAARNDPEKIRFRLTLRFSMLYFVLFALGILLCRRTWLGSLSVWQTNIQALLASPFTECVRARDYIRVLLRCSRFEMMLLAMLTVSGMTYFSRTASGALLAAHAFLFGCMSCRLLTDLLAGNPAPPHGNLVFFVY